MDKEAFEQILAELANRLTADVNSSTQHHNPIAFEDFVRSTLHEILLASGYSGAMDPRVQGFPDIVVGNYGVEVKYTANDSWRCIANSVSEGNRALDVKHVYIVYGKIGGRPEVRWADYGESICHVRTSHVPRFEVDLSGSRSLFAQIGQTYETFRTLDMHEKMSHIRNYARGRLKEGERLWWLEDKEEDDQQHSLPLAVRIYMDLSMEEKRKIRAEAAILSPAIVSSSRNRRKYNDAVLYMMTYRGVLCPQARDLFTAGSVAGKDRGGSYLLRALLDIQDEMRQAALSLEDALFQEYWGVVPAPEQRILEWLRRADAFALNWRPSEYLFLDEQA